MGKNKIIARKITKTNKEKRERRRKMDKVKAGNCVNNYGKRQSENATIVS